MALRTAWSMSSTVTPLLQRRGVELHPPNRTSKPMAVHQTMSQDLERAEQRWAIRLRHNGSFSGGLSRPHRPGSSGDIGRLLRALPDAASGIAQVVLLNQMVDNGTTVA